MGKFLGQSPLTALFYAAVSVYITVFIPYSEAYKAATSAFVMPMLGYVYIIAYGLWLSIIIAVAFGNAKSKEKGMVLSMLLFVSIVLTQFVVNLLRAILFGETTGTMTRLDLLFELGRLSVSALLLLVLAALLFKHPPHVQQPGKPAAPAAAKLEPKTKIKKANFVVMLIVLPLVYTIIYFLTWYFLLISSEAARVYYSGVADHRSFIQEIINMLLTNSKQVIVALLRGLVLCIALIPMLLQLAHKRVMFIAVAIMLYLGVAIQYLIPVPTMPDAVRMAHLVEYAADAVAYGALAGFLLHLCVKIEKPAAPAAPAGRPRAGAGAAPPPPPAKA